MPAGVTNIRISCYNKETLLTVHRDYIAKWSFLSTQSPTSEVSIFEVEQLQNHW